MNELKYLDKEEKELIEQINSEQDQYVSDTSPGTLAHFKKVALNSREKRGKVSKMISLRLPVEDIESIKKRAESDGLPYQTLIASIIHRYNNGRLSDTTGKAKQKSPC